MSSAVWRGTVPASAFLIDASLIGQDEAQRRVVALWSPGVTVLRCGTAWLVRIPAPVTIAVTEAPGLPLVRRGPAYAGFEIAEEALEALGPLHDPTVIRFEAGVMTVTPLTASDAVDPAAWLDVSGFTRLDPTTLGAAPEMPRIVAKPEERDVRQLLDVPPLAEPLRMEGLLKALGSTKAPEPERAPREETYSPSAVLRIICVIAILSLARTGNLTARVALLAIVVLACGLAIAIAIRRQGGASRTVASAVSAITVPRRVGFRPNRLRAAITRFFALTRLSTLIGRVHARYFMKMLSFFDDQNFDEALRHAIPLGGDGVSAGLSFAPPGRRDALNLSLGAGRPAYSVPMGPELYAELQRRYRAAFERLDQLGRYDDAAFVLAELLRDNLEAVAYLERRGELRKAAQLAEARFLEPDLIVRQWMLAGDRDRAIGFARLYGAFGPAVTRLEATHPDTARLLRAYWGEWLASSGSYALAVDVIWAMEELRGMAEAWIDRAIEQGGVPAGRMLVRRMILVPSRKEETLQTILRHLAEEDEEHVPLRAAIGSALRFETRTAEVRTATRASVRAAVRDAPLTVTPVDLRSLAQHSGDHALRTDLPTIPARARWSADVSLGITFESADTGAMPVYDVAVLNDGRVAVALGEAGVRVLSRDGRRVAHFDQPADRLIISDARDRAIAIAGRGRVLRLTRIDFAARTAAYWCDTELSAYAADYDGSIWFAARGSEILALDATAKHLDALWHNPDFPGHITSLARSAKWLGLLGYGAEGVHSWVYELPKFRLSQREAAKREEQMSGHVTSPDGILLAVSEGNDHSSSAVIQHGARRVAFPPFNQDVQPHTAGAWPVFATGDDHGIVVLLGDETGRVRARISLEGARRTAPRVQGGTFAVADDLGRALVLDLVSGVITHDLRT